MKGLRKKIITVLTVAAIAASSCGCGLNKDAKTLADAYVLSLLSMNTDDLRLKSAPGTDGNCFSSYEGEEWKTEYVRHILQAGRASIDLDNSYAS